MFASSLAALIGCADNAVWDTSAQANGPEHLAPPDEVFRLVCAYQPPFWKNYHPEQADAIEGFKFNLYCISRKTSKGVLTEGVLQTRMFEWQELEDGTRQRHEICSWTQPLKDTPRTRQEYQFGWAYQPHYFWGEIDVAGKDVEVVVWLESADRRKIYAQTRFLRVPDRRYAGGSR